MRILHFAVQAQDKKGFQKPWSAGSLCFCGLLVSEINCGIFFLGGLWLLKKWSARPFRKKASFSRLLQRDLRIEGLWHIPLERLMAPLK